MSDYYKEIKLTSWIGRIVTVLCLCLFVFFLLIAEGCRVISINKPTTVSPTTMQFEVTGYDSGPKSCGWERNWYGRPVYSYGPKKGQPKKVGITASGLRAKHGTIAADTAYYPFGTVMYVPGYGYGRVEDRGGAIKGSNKIDVWFSTEREALNWGRKKNVEVKVWIPPKKPQNLPAAQKSKQ